MEPNDLVLWIESRRALVAGDALIDRSHGLEFPADWANKGVPPEQIPEALRPLLELPVEPVLPAHGPPTDRAALERALS
jgi:glyoxylase-like metal-dependent hydrolase (beta-lactamase superfamily II)